MRMTAILMALLFVSCASKNIKSDSPRISIYRDGKLVSDKWKLSDKHSPDMYFENLKNGETKKVTFKTDKEKVTYEVSDKDVYDFTVEYKGKKFKQRIVGEVLRKKANFTAQYQRGKHGTIDVTIPEVYELVNIAIAISDYGKNKDGLVVKDSEYYARVIKWFDKYRDHKFVKEINTLLEADTWSYFNAKMNGYAFVFENDKIVRNPNFGATGFMNNNLLAPYMEEMQDFSDKSNFRKFYRDETPFYDSKIRYYTFNIGLKDMLAWLNRNFPGKRSYDYTHVIFSPLVGSNQSLISFEDNGFKELQPHVNYPHDYLYNHLRKKDIGETAINAYKGTIVFTELNHGFADLVSEKYRKRIVKATVDKDNWLNKDMQRFYKGIKIFNEYMNWALVSLRLTDLTKGKEQKELLRQINHTMVKKRGFAKFEKLTNYLVPLYEKNKNRKTVAQMYPQIVRWFEKN
jgi:hypothetical protein